MPLSRAEKCPAEFMCGYLCQVHLRMHSVVVQQRPQLLRQAVHLDIHNAKLIQRIPPAP